MIIRNAAQCRRCGAMIESTYRHDYQACTCGSIFVDGGHDYLRHGGDLSMFIDLSIVRGNPMVRDQGLFDRTNADE